MSLISHITSPRIRRTLMALAGIGLAAGLTACGHSLAAERPDGPPPGAGPACMDGDGMGMGRMHGMRHHGGPPSAEDMARHRDRMVERVTKDLGLDTAQKANFTKLIDAMHAQRRAMAGSEPGAMREQMQALVKGDRFDTAKATELANQRAESMRKGSPEVIQAMATFYDSLKPEQQAKVRDFMARGPGRGHGMGMMGMHG